jgi:hypothetical protein
MKIGRWVWLAGLCLLFSVEVAFGQSIFVAKGKENAPHEPMVLKLPYAFYNENFGGAVAGVYGANGWPQKQSTFLATVIGGTNSAVAGYFLGQNFQMPWIDRLFLDPIIGLSHFGDTDSYQNGNPDYRGQQAGTNDSSENNYVNGTTNDNFAYLRFKYLLPIGHGKEVINTYVLDRGLLYKGATGGTSWNPLTSGKTYIEVQPFYRVQTIDASYNDFTRRTNGLNYSLRYENTDFYPNPSDGNTIRLRYSEDYGWFDSTVPYNVISGEYSHYINLGASDRFRQRVLALDFWTADVPSWNESDTEGGQQVFHRPPGFQGANLGGLWRMRAYPTSRFNDRAAIYYCAELRMIPEWNPFAHIGWVEKYLGIAWWQWVAFTEVGRVAPSWTFDTLNSHVKFDMGVGVRAMAKGIVIRIDVAGSSESYGVAMMVSQPFQF